MVKKFLDASTIIKISQDLNLDTKYINDIIQLAIPSERRNDIKDSTDVAEEVARIYGFNNFHDTLPRFKQLNALKERRQIKQKIRRILRSLGLHEVINNSFESKKAQSSSIYIVNPLNREQKILRKNIIGGIIASKQYNTNQANDNFEAFEIGHVFIKKSDTKKYQESLHLGYLLENDSFNRSTWQTFKTPLTWLQAKGHAEELFERINAKISWSKTIGNNAFSECIIYYTHPKNRIYVVNNNQAIGILSQVNYPDQTTTRNSYFLEINLYELVKAIQPVKHLQYIYNQYSNYPKITRDFSIKVSSKIAMETIQNTIEDIKKKAKQYN